MMMVMMMLKLCSFHLYLHCYNSVELVKHCCQWCGSWCRCVVSLGSLEVQTLTVLWRRRQLKAATSQRDPTTSLLNRWTPSSSSQLTSSAPRLLLWLTDRSCIVFLILLSVVTSAKGRQLCFYLLSVWLIVCLLDYSESYERILMKFEIFWCSVGQEERPACKSSATTIYKSLLLGTGLIWNNQPTLE